MLPDRVSNPGPLTYESGALPIALRGPAKFPGAPLFCSLEFSDLLGSLSSVYNKMNNVHRTTGVRRRAPLQNTGLYMNRFSKINSWLI